MVPFKRGGRKQVRELGSGPPPSLGVGGAWRLHPDPCLDKSEGGTATAEGPDEGDAAGVPLSSVPWVRRQPRD